MAALGGAVAALQAATQAEPLGSGYDMAVETLALACAAATQLARQARRPLHPYLLPSCSCVGLGVGETSFECYQTHMCNIDTCVLNPMWFCAHSMPSYYVSTGH